MKDERRDAGEPTMISVPQRVLCLVAHPDDLEPQAGGTILRLTDAGSEVHVVHAVTPNLSPDGTPLPDHQSQRETEADQAGSILDIDSSLYLGYDPNDLHHTQSTVQVFDSIVYELAPDLIISHHEIDTQQDHVVMAKIAQTVCRRNHIALWQLSHSFPGGYLSHRPQPNLFVDITSVFDQKMVAVAAYQSQRDRYSGLFENNWLEIIEARDRYYGGMLNQDGLSTTRYAEGFVVSKMVWKE
jgi:LmbE family N-acetylglucosaminyl deacetylase